MEEVVLKMAKGFFGYGTWSAPYWFIGPEPGGDDGAANRARAWQRCGMGELVDVAAHTEEINDPRYNFFGHNARTQETWRGLIWLLLAYRGIEPTREATLYYQRQTLGRLDGETLLAELSSFPARNMGVGAPRGLYRDHRVARFRERFLENTPEFIIFYKPSYLSSWKQVAGDDLILHEPMMVGKTACLVTDHPQRTRNKRYWIDMGTRLRCLRVAADIAD